MFRDIVKRLDKLPGKLKMIFFRAPNLRWKGWCRRWESLRHAILRVVGAALLVVYCGWQVFWLAQGRIPPALFLALTDLPAPTTGGTRSIVHLVRGEWRESLHCNPMAVPITLLFILSVGWLLLQGMRGRGWCLPHRFLVAWLGLLAVAWFIKLAQQALSENSCVHLAPGGCIFPHNDRLADLGTFFFIKGADG